MPKLAANISMMFTEVDFLDRFEVAAMAGLSAEAAWREAGEAASSRTSCRTL